MMTLALLTPVPQDPEPAAEPSVVEETLHLGEGKVITGEVLKETEETLYVDVGFGVVEVPTRSVTRREHATKSADAPMVDEEVFFRAERPERSVSEGAKLVGEAVVKIESPSGQGSGFITSPEGYIVTNFHVVEGEIEVDVTLFLESKNGFDLKTVRKVKVIAVNPQIDLALIKMDPPEGVELQHVYVGDSEDIEVGQKVYAIGTPIGLERTVSSGIISVTNRTFGGHTHFQITTPINPGNSGGPLFNLRGEVIGVNSSGYTGLQGLNFAIPSKYVADFLRNRDAFAVDSTRSENGIQYLPAPRKPKPESDQ